MGDPFNPNGFLKQPATSYGRRDYALTKVPGSGGKTVSEQMFIDRFIPRTAKSSTRRSFVSAPLSPK